MLSYRRGLKCCFRNSLFDFRRVYMIIFKRLFAFWLVREGIISSIKLLLTRVPHAISPGIISWVCLVLHGFFGFKHSLSQHCWQCPISGTMKEMWSAAPSRRRPQWVIKTFDQVFSGVSNLRNRNPFVKLDNLCFFNIWLPGFERMCNWKKNSRDEKTIECALKKPTFARQSAIRSASCW